MRRSREVPIGAAGSSPPAAAGPSAPSAPTAAAPGELAFASNSRLAIEFQDDTITVFYLLEIVNPGAAVALEAPGLAQRSRADGVEAERVVEDAGVDLGCGQGDCVGQLLHGCPHVGGIGELEMQQHCAE